MRNVRIYNAFTDMFFLLLYLPAFLPACSSGFFIYSIISVKNSGTWTVCASMLNIIMSKGKRNHTYFTQSNFVCAFWMCLTGRLGDFSNWLAWRSRYVYVKISNAICIICENVLCTAWAREMKTDEPMGVHLNILLRFDLSKRKKIM